MIDLLDPALHATDEIHRIFRSLPAVSWTKGRRSAGYWSIVGHAELCEAARDPATFSSHWGTRPEVLRPPEATRPLHNLDPPQHTARRATARATASRDRFDAIAIDATLPLGACDAVADIAEPIVMRAFASWLAFEDPSAILAMVQRVHEAGAELVDAVRDPDRMLAAARATSEIARAMGNDDLRSLFVLAGIPTTIDAIGSAIVDLLAHPATYSDALVEELLRRASPIAQFARRATRDTMLGDCAIETGDQVVLWFVAANRDPRVFDRPDDLVADRAPNPHVAFGVGPHRCIGAAFGRKILRAVVRAILAHEIALIEPPTRRASSYLRGYTRVPIYIKST